MIHSSFPAGAILTNGLGTDACDGALITAAKWHLLGCDPTIIIQIPSGGSGSKSYNPGEIQTLYRPVYDEDTLEYIDYNPVNNNAKNIVKVKFTMNDITTEKEFKLKEKPFKMVINLINIVNVTSKLTNAIVNSITNKLHEIKIRIKNIKRN